MLRKIYFYGALEEAYGRGPIELDCSHMAHVMSGLNSYLPGFRKTFEQHKEYIICKTVAGENYAVEPDEIGMLFGNVEEIHFIPSVEGSGIEIAAAMLAVAATSATAIVVGTIINIAIAFAVSAIAQALAPSPSSSQSGTGRPEDHQSFLFSGAMNVVEQGGPVPLVYGETRVGSTMISAGVTTEDSATIGTPTPGTPPTTPGNPGGGTTGPLARFDAAPSQFSKWRHFNMTTEKPELMLRLQQGGAGLSPQQAESTINEHYEWFNSSSSPFHPVSFQGIYTPPSTFQYKKLDGNTYSDISGEADDYVLERCNSIGITPIEPINGTGNGSGEYPPVTPNPPPGPYEDFGTQVPFFATPWNVTWSDDKVLVIRAGAGGTVSAVTVDGVQIQLCVSDTPGAFTFVEGKHVIANGAAPPLQIQAGEYASCKHGPGTHRMKLELAS